MFVPSEVNEGALVDEGSEVDEGALVDEGSEVDEGVLKVTLR